MRLCPIGRYQNIRNGWGKFHSHHLARSSCARDLRIDSAVADSRRETFDVINLLKSIERPRIAGWFRVHPRQRNWRCRTSRPTNGSWPRSDDGPAFPFRPIRRMPSWWRPRSVELPTHRRPRSRRGRCQMRSHRASRWRAGQPVPW